MSDQYLTDVDPRPVLSGWTMMLKYSKSVSENVLQNVYIRRYDHEPKIHTNYAFSVVTEATMLLILYSYVYVHAWVWWGCIVTLQIDVHRPLGSVNNTSNFGGNTYVTDMSRYKSCLEQMRMAEITIFQLYMHWSTIRYAILNC